MATKMLMPLLGQTMEEGTIIKWLKNEGDKIQAGEPLLEVMTDKVNMEVEAPESGVLRKILAQPDDVIPVKDPICIIGTADEPIEDLSADQAPALQSESPGVQEAAAPATPSAPQAPSASAPAGEGRLFASPAARRIAAEHGIDASVLAGRGSGPNGRVVEKDVLDFVASAKATPLAGKMARDMGAAVGAIEGSGVGGRVTSEDIRRATAAPAVFAAPAAPAPALAIGQSIPFTGMRKAVANNVAASAFSAVHVTLVMEVDMSECAKLRSSILADVEARYGVRVSYTDFITKAAAKAIEDKPIVNASIQGDQIVIHDRINIGIATAIENGLVVPVVKDVQAKSIPQISREIKELSGKARSGQAGGADFQGGTFTISNLGVYGVESFNPVITPGQSAILGVCRIAEKPVVVDGEVKVHPMMNLCLSFDHRVMDGAPAAEYLARLRDILESPYLMFM